jgi:hypothetical protein
MFDPYEKWLGISRDQRPLNYYQLLGLTPREQDEDAIEAAAERQLKLIRRHREGPHAQVCARLLKEIDQARGILLDPVKRRKYDALLRAKAAKTAGPEEADEELVEVQAADEADEEAAEEEPDEEAVQASPPAPVPARKKLAAAKPTVARGGGRKRHEPEEKKRAPVGLIIGIVAGAAAALLVVCGGVGYFMFLRLAETPVTPPPVAAAPPPPVVAPPPPPPPPAPEVKPPPPPPPAPEVKPPPPPPPPPPPEVKPPPRWVKLPVPDAAAQAVAEKTLKNTYKADYEKTKPEDRLALAAKFLQPGRENRANPAEWFVLLREARDLSVAAERPRLAVEAIDEIDKWFVIDPLDLKLKGLTTLADSTSDPVVKRTADVALAQVKQAMRADNFDVGQRLLDLADKAKQKVAKGDKKALDKVQARREELAEARKEYEAVAAAKKKLAQAPDDPAASMEVGKHLCYFCDRWDDGLPLLAKCGDAVLQALARKDLGEPGDVKEQIYLGDGWWALGKWRRAVYWYALAETRAPEADKARVVARLKDEEERDPPGTPRLLTGSFYGRSNAEDRVLLLREGGGTMRSEEAVDRGLEWLAKHQSPSGMWSTNAFHEAGKCDCGDEAEEVHDVGGTAFGLLPFLARGETPKQGRYAKTVQKGLAYLVGQQLQKKEGNYSDNMYENALATLAVAEAYGLTRDRRYGESAAAAAAFIVKAQHPEGSWGYSPGAKGDTSVTGWQFSALKTALYAGIPVPPLSFARVGNFLKTVANPNHLGYGYNSTEMTPRTSAVGLLCEVFLGTGPHDPSLAKGIDNLLLPSNFMTRENPNIYFVFSTTQVMHHYGGRKWETWNTKTRDLLIDLQDQGTEQGHTHQKGSWSPSKDAWTKQGGRIMFTSLALLTLEMYYYSVPLNGYGAAVVED